MTNKSGVASQVISLPSGGGAVQGIGETFAPDLFTGTGNLTVPIAVPPGRNGFQPKLDLTYSTGNGNGPFGLGWALTVPQVTRKTSRGIPRYRDDATDPQEHDTFLLSGSEDLVAVGPPSAGVTRFRPRTEGSFARIEHVRDGGDFWRVRSRDGLVSRYGAAGTGEAVVSDPQDASKIFCWLLAETTDPFGNRIEYDYLSDRGADGPHVWDQRYLQRIRYVDYGQDSGRRFLVSVTFAYEERPDPFSDHRAGFEVRTRLRCKRIEVRTHPDDDEVLVRTFELVYLDERVRAGELDAAVLPPNGVSLLSQVRVVGHDDVRSQALPPLELGYSTFAPEQQRLAAVEGTNDTLPRRSLADEDFELVDLFGNGLPDIVQMNGATQFWRNLGNGLFDIPRTMAEVPAGVHLREPGTQFGDLNGDGRADLLVLDQGGYFPLSFTGRWSPQGFVRYPAAPSVPFGDGNLRLVDLDGDGVVDALRTGSSFELFFNDPVNGWDTVETRPRRPLADFPDVTFADPQVKLADLTGDGLQDIVLVEQGLIQYWPYLGQGRWGRRITMADSPIFRDPVLPPGQFDPRRVLLGDLDGDGLDDIVYVEPDRVTIWINQSGNGWGEPITVEGTPRFPDIDAVRLVDLFGTGSAGILWTTDAPDRHQFVELTGGVKPYLLTAMNNHIGGVTHIQYAASTRFYLADVENPQTRWKTPLPFPVQVVAAVEVIDEVSRGKLTTEYRYHHGYWDGAEREFRGFGMVEQLDTETFERFNTSGLHGGDAPFDPVAQERFSPPLLTKTWFHLGPVGDEFGERGEADFTAEYWPEDRVALERPADTVALLPSLPASHRADALRSLRGHVLRTELYALDGSARERRPFTVTESQYGIRQEHPGGAGEGGDRARGVFFPHLVAQRTTQWERGTEPMVQFTFTDDYDGFGLPRRRISLAVPRGRDFRVAAPAGEPYLGTVTLTSYAQRDDERRYRVDRVAAVTTYEIENDGSQPLLDLRAAVTAGGARLAMVGQQFRYYDGDPFTGLPLGRLGAFGALTRSEALVLTHERLRQAYDNIPPYLVRTTGPNQTGEYPPPFRQQLPPLAGYTLHPDGGGYFADIERRRYDFHDDSAGRGRGLLTATRDALDRTTTIAYDRFALLPVAVTDPVGLTTTATYDYRVLQPKLVTDPNGNRTAFAFTPLGLLERIALLGKQGEQAGDTLQAPGTRLTYDFGHQPVSVHTVRRVHHAGDTAVPAAERDSTIETNEYSDGFGRLVQTRTQAEDVLFGDPAFGRNVLPPAQGDPATVRDVMGQRAAPGTNVVASGLQVYDNKGRVVEQYEPFYATGRAYQPPTDAQRGQRVTKRYDTLGRMVSTMRPDGSQRRVVHGIPSDLADPDRFTPTPWEVYTYDANDNAGRTSPSEAAGYEHHWNTPSSIVLDPLGRTAVSVERQREPRAEPDGALPPVQEVPTRFAYDIRGNVLRIIDPLSRLAFQYVYDLADRPLRATSIDAGVAAMVRDAAGDEIERRDGKGALVLRAYDAARRPIRRWARDNGVSMVTLRERLVYGDGSDPDQPAAQRAANAAANRLGALHQHYDEAGLVTYHRYDFKGNVLAKNRQILRDDVTDVDWDPPTATPLGEDGYETTTAYDALSRVTKLRLPQDVTGRRSELRPGYNRAGALEQVRLNGQVFVEHIAYNAAGQRTLVALGNGVLTRYAYNPRTSQLVRLRTERYTKQAPDTPTYRLAGTALQDSTFSYDLADNLLQIVDRTPGCGVRANPEAGGIADPELRALVAAGDALIRRFGYDPRYRLVSATGRECGDGPPQPWLDQGRCGFATTPSDANAAELSTVYRETYSYDTVNNLLRLLHTARAASTTRRFDLVPDTNQLTTFTTGTAVVPYTYDASGNMTGETESRSFEWDSANRLVAFRVQAGGAEPSVQARYRYDAAGERVQKLVRRQGGGIVVTTYIDGVFEHLRWQVGGTAGANNHLHLMDGQRRIALVRAGAPPPDDTGPAVQYHLGDHLDSSHLVVDGDGAVVNREEYTPYGDTSLGSFARKRYRFTGRERDEESSLYYHGTRYYSPWLARWTSCDPAGATEGVNAYEYAGNCPLRYVDPEGTQKTTATREAGYVVETTSVGNLTTSKCLWYDPNPLARLIGAAAQNDNDLVRPDVENIRPSTSVEEAILRHEPVEPTAYFQQEAELREIGEAKIKSQREARELAAALRKEPHELDAWLRVKTQAERAEMAVIYLRHDPSTGRLYVGRTTGDELGRMLTRQAEHQARLGQTFVWRILEQVEPSRARAVEESWIRRFGGPERYGGRLQNWRYEISNEEYERQMRSGGLRPIPRPTPNRALGPRAPRIGRVPSRSVDATREALLAD